MTQSRNCCQAPEGQDTSSENLLPADLNTILHPMREIYCSQINAIFVIGVAFLCKVMRHGGRKHINGKRHKWDFSKYLLQSDALINSQTISQQTCCTISWITHSSPVVQWKFRSSFRFVIQKTRWSSGFDYITVMLKSNMLLLCLVGQISANNVILSTGKYR